MLVRILGQGKLATKQFSNSVCVDRWIAPDGAARDAARNLFSKLSARPESGQNCFRDVSISNHFQRQE